MAFAIKPLNIDIVAKNKFTDVFSTLKSDLGAASSKVGTFNNKLGKTSAMLAQKSQQLAKTGKNLRSTGKNLSLGLTAPIVGLGYASVRAFQAVEDGMQNVASLDVGENRIKQLTMDVGNLTEFVGKSTEDISGGLYQVVSAFGDTSDSAEILKINAIGAAAGLATVTDAVNLTSAVTKAYGDTSAAAVQKVSDLAFQTVKLGQTTFPELAASIGAVTPLAKELGTSQEQLFGIFATGTGVTGNTAEVATQLKGVYSALMSPTAKMTELYKKLGVTGGKELIKNQGGIAQTMKLLVDTAKSSNTPLKDFIGSIRGQTIALAMAGPQYDTLIKKTNAMSNAVGAADSAFAQQQKKSSFQVAQFREMVNNNLAMVGEIIIPVMLDVMRAIKPVLTAFKNMSPATKKIIVATLGLAAALGPVIVGLGFVASGISSILALGATIAPMLAPAMVVFSKIGVFFSSLPALVAALNPVGLAIGAFTASFTLATIAFEKFFTNIQSSATAPKWIKNFANDWLRGLDAMKEGFADLGSFITNVFTGVWSFAIDGFKSYLNFVGSSLSKVASIIPDWMKESVGIDVSGEVSGGTTSEEITKMQSENFINKTILQKQQQDVNVNFGNMPQGASVESQGDNIAYLNTGFTG